MNSNSNSHLKSCAGRRYCISLMHAFCCHVLIFGMKYGRLINILFGVELVIYAIAKPMMMTLSFFNEKVSILII